MRGYETLANSIPQNVNNVKMAAASHSAEYSDISEDSDTKLERIFAEISKSLFS
jgi:hypothetical protein